MERERERMSGEGGMRGRLDSGTEGGRNDHSSSHSGRRNKDYITKEQGHTPKGTPVVCPVCLSCCLCLAWLLCVFLC